jgi:DNA uptake protein ComE-like DNA-binding protein
MKSNIAKTTFITLSLLLSVSLCSAAETKATTAQAPASAAAAKGAKSSAPSTAKAAAPAKLVDINSAKKEELKTLPGITDAEADKIIAGRPYGSKAWLTTHKVLPDEVYANIRTLVIARQPTNDATKNAEAYKKK